MSKSDHKNSKANLNATTKSVGNSPLEKVKAQLADMLHPEQSLELLQALHIVTRDGSINQDSRRKLKQIYHLYRFFEPLLLQLLEKGRANIVDHGSGKSYLGFILYDLFFKTRQKNNSAIDLNFWNVESRPELIETSRALARSLSFDRMNFLASTIQDSVRSEALPKEFDLVCALHACDVATDFAIDFAIAKSAQFLFLVPCCQAEVCRHLNQSKSGLKSTAHYEIFRHPLHTREFGSHLTNVLRCLRLEAEGYKVTVTEFTGLEHSLKNELIVAEKSVHINAAAKEKSKQKIQSLLKDFGIEALTARFNGSF